MRRVRAAGVQRKFSVNLTQDWVVYNSETLDVLFRPRVVLKDQWLLIHVTDDPSDSAKPVHESEIKPVVHPQTR